MTPNSSMVAVAWAKTVPGVNPSYVATTLPANNLTFGLSGFVTATIVGGYPDAYLPVGHPHVQFDVYAINPDSGRPPWFAAERVCAAIVAGARGIPINRSPLTLPSGYGQARVLEVGGYMSEPMRGYGDEGSLAHMFLEVSMHWTVI